MHEYVVGENQQKKYSFLIDKTSAVHDMHIRFYVERDAKLVVEILIASTTIKVHVECILLGVGADARIMGAYVVDASNQVQIVTTQHHVVADTHSTLVMKGVLRDNAQAQYHGTVRIEKEARGAYASQENKNMLLSNHARVVSVPSLEVLTHDVHCFHGSAIGRFDDEQLFYAAARGIDEETAQELLLNAFFTDLFVDEGLRKQMHVLIG